MTDWDEIKGWLGMIALVIAIFLLVFVVQIASEIPERGLRSVLVEIWEGPSSDREE